MFPTHFNGFLCCETYDSHSNDFKVTYYGIESECDVIQMYVAQCNWPDGINILLWQIGNVIT